MGIFAAVAPLWKVGAAALGAFSAHQVVNIDSRPAAKAGSLGGNPYWGKDYSRVHMGQRDLEVVAARVRPEELTSEQVAPTQINDASITKQAKLFFQSGSAENAVMKLKVFNKEVGESSWLNPGKKRNQGDPDPPKWPIIAMGGIGATTAIDRYLALVGPDERTATGLLASGLAGAAIGAVASPHVTGAAENLMLAFGVGSGLKWAASGRPDELVREARLERAAEGRSYKPVVFGGELLGNAVSGGAFAAGAAFLTVVAPPLGLGLTAAGAGYLTDGFEGIRSVDF